MIPLREVSLLCDRFSVFILVEMKGERVSMRVIDLWGRVRVEGGGWGIRVERGRCLGSGMAVS